MTDPATVRRLAEDLLRGVETCRLCLRNGEFCPDCNGTGRSPIHSTDDERLIARAALDGLDARRELEELWPALERWVKRGAKGGQLADALREMYATIAARRGKGSE